MTKRPPDSPEVKEPATIESAALDTVTGGLQWPMWTYKVGAWAARQDPAMLATNFLM